MENISLELWAENYADGNVEKELYELGYGTRVNGCRDKKRLRIRGCIHKSRLMTYVVL